MILRNLPFAQWVLILILLVVIIYLRLRLNDLEESYRSLRTYLNVIAHELSKNNVIFSSDDAVARIDARNDDGHAEIRGASEDLEDIVVIYNRVPKTASTSFMGLVYDLCKQNKYHVLHINVTNNMHTLTFANQVQIEDSYSLTCNL